MQFWLGFELVMLHLEHVSAAPKESLVVTMADSMGALARRRIRRGLWEAGSTEWYLLTTAFY